MDPNSEPTGNILFVLIEVYETPAGVSDHFAQAEESWEDFPAFVDWLGKCKSTVVPLGRRKSILPITTRL